jgi:hypothetical protein
MSSYVLKKEVVVDWKQPVLIVVGVVDLLKCYCIIALNDCKFTGFMLFLQWCLINQSYKVLLQTSLVRT